MLRCVICDAVFAFERNAVSIGSACTPRHSRTSPEGVIVAVEIDAETQTAINDSSRFAPQSLRRPRIVVAVRVHDWDEVEVIGVEQ